MATILAPSSHSVEHVCVAEWLERGGCWEAGMKNGVRRWVRDLEKYDAKKNKDRTIIEHETKIFNLPCLGCREHETSNKREKPRLNSDYRQPFMPG